MSKARETREQKRNRLANEVCREVRYQIVKHGLINGNNCDKVMDLVSSWMEVTGKVKYERP